MFMLEKPDLDTARLLVFLELGAFVALALVAVNLGYRFEFLLIPLWLFNLVPTLHIAGSARNLGRSVALFGVISALGPPGALFAVSLLKLSVHFKRG